jgi:hypothetical protein
MEEEGQLFCVRWWYSVVVSISGCDPLDPGSNPGTAILLVLCSFVFVFVRLPQNVFGVRVYSTLWDKGSLSRPGDHPHQSQQKDGRSVDEEKKNVLHSVGLEPTPTKWTTT